MSAGSRSRAPALPALGAVLVAALLLVGCSSGAEAPAAPPSPADASARTSASTATVPDPAPSLRIVSAPTGSVPVGPPPQSPLALVRRDCGTSVGLPTGGAVWLYCDTTMFGADGRLRWFINSSAAVARADDPLVMLEPVDGDDRVVPVVTPRPDYPVCDEGEGRFSWPTAAVPLDPGDGPSGGRGDVSAIAVFYGNVCVVPRDFEAGDKGLAVLEVPPVPAEGVPAAPLEARLVTPRLFPTPPDGAAFGQTAVRVDDHMYLYRCPRADLPCEVARAPARLDDLADRDRYEVWTGSGWVPHGAAGDAAGPMVMPDARLGLKPSVEWLPELGVLVWADNRLGDPGEVWLRVARDPWGPWSEPVVVELPGCTADYPDICFAVEVHDQLSGPGTIGLTWFDSAVPLGVGVPLRSATVGVEVDGDAR